MCILVVELNVYIVVCTVSIVTGIKSFYTDSKWVLSVVAIFLYC